MSSRNEVEVTITSAKDLKNVNWRYGPIRPYVVVWIDSSNKCTTRVDEESDTFPVWDQTLTIPVPPGERVEDQTLCIDVVHARRGDEDTKPLIGSARLRLSEVLDEAGFGERVKRSLQLKRPSGRPHGKVEVKVVVKDTRYRSQDAYYAPQYGVPPPSSTRDYYGQPYSSAPQQNPDYYGQPYSSAPQQNPYYGAPVPQPPQYGYGGEVVQQEEKKKSKFGGMGTGLAVGAVAGVLGGIALTEGFEHLENKIAQDAADKVEDDQEEEDVYDDDEDY